MTIPAVAVRDDSRTLSPLISEWPAHVREDWEERSALIAEGCRMPRDRAEACAESLVRDRYRRGLL